MKKLIYILIYITSTCYSQSGWVFQNPGTNNQLKSVSFVNSNTGFVVGFSGTILKTTTGGQNWIDLSVSPQNNFWGVQFMNENTGTAVGFYGSYSSLIMKTTDGGNSWTQQSVNGNSYLKSVSFIDLNTGVTVGNFGGSNGLIFRTSNGGTNWDLVFQSAYTGFNCVTFYNSTNSYALSTYYGVFKSTDTGKTWNQYSIGNNYQPMSISFADINTGYCAGNSGIILKSTNGGVNWSNILTNITVDLDAVQFINANTGTIVGSIGTIIRTTNGGISWVNQSLSYNNSINSVFYINPGTGYAVGYRTDTLDHGLILKTTTGGTPPFTLYVTDTNTSSPLFYWTKVQNTISYNLQISLDQNFSNPIINVQTPDTFYRASGLTYGMCFYSRVKADTSTWSNILYFCTHYLTVSGTVRYLDNNLPVTAGYVKALELNKITGQVITVDSIRIQTNGSYMLPHVHQDSTYIMAYADDVDAPIFVPTYYDTTIYWRNAHVIYPTGNMTNIDIHVFRANPPSGPMHIGGGVFTNQSSLVGLPNSIIYAKSGNQFRGYSISGSTGIYRIDSLTQGSYNVICDRLGYDGGTKNVSLSSANQDTVNFYLVSVIGIKKINNSIPATFTLSQNYPNPFNPVTTIKFDIPKSSNVKLIIYDLLGKEVIKLADDKLNPGTYNIEWNASSFASGVYFYKLTAGDYIQTKKLVLIK